MARTKPYCYDYPHPALAADVVLFTARGGLLEVLLIERGQPPFAGAWALPGGFLNADEDLAQCAARELAEETGLGNLELTQLGAFSNLDRDPRERVVSVAWLGLVPADDLDTLAPVPGDDAAAARWFALADLPALAFDHGAIIDAARARLLESLPATTLVARLLPASFTLRQLRRVYEAVIDAPLHKHDFRDWLDELGLVEPAGAKRERHGRNPAPLYRWRARKPYALPS